MAPQTGVGHLQQVRAVVLEFKASLFVVELLAAENANRPGTVSVHCTTNARSGGA